MRSLYCFVVYRGALGEAMTYIHIARLSIAIPRVNRQRRPSIPSQKRSPFSTHICRVEKKVQRAQALTSTEILQNLWTPSLANKKKKRNAVTEKQIFKQILTATTQEFAQGVEPQKKCTKNIVEIAGN